MFPRDHLEYQKLKLCNASDKHLNWSNRTPSPFISVYADFDTVINSAITRKNQGKRGVLIARIDVSKSGKLWYRYMPKVAKEVGLRIKPQALNNSENEFVFLHRIPGEAIVEIIPVP